MKNIITLSSLVFFTLVAATPAIAIDAGNEVPEFSLENTDGKKVSLSDFKDKVVVLEWFNDQCPFVKKHYGVNAMQELQQKWTGEGIVWLTIDSTNPNHQNFRSNSELGELVEKQKISSTAVLKDPEGKVGKMFGAKTTPHFFIRDKAGKLAYKGAVDDNPDAFSVPSEAKNYVDLAFTQITSGKQVETTETRPYGWSVKY